MPPLQEKPSSRVAETYTPPGGTRYPVKTGDTWGSVARAHGIDAWDLMDFNFPGIKQIKKLDGQRATRYVNWYLSEYVGCQTSSDGLNWSFTSGLTNGKGGWKGGYIYVPPSSPKPPAPPPAPPKASRPPCKARRPDFYRLLNPPEQGLAMAVFGQTLPPWTQIGIGNGLGADGRPWTSNGLLIEGVDFPLTPDVRFALNVGDLASYDLTSTLPTRVGACTGGSIVDTFVHEMTHVWQMHNDPGTSGVMIRSLWAQEFGAGYDYTPGDSWDSYNVEQQAHLVADWNKYKDTNAALAEDLYPYVRLVIRSGHIDYPRGLSLAELKSDVTDLQRRGLD